MPSSSDVRPWQRAVGVALLAGLVASAAYDQDFLGFAGFVRPAAAVAAAPADAGSTFVDVTEAAGLGGFVRSGWDVERTTYAWILGGGAGVADVDADGREDVVLTGGVGDPNRIFLNRGDGSFEDATATWGPLGTGPCGGVAFGDVESDGDPDLAIACVGEVRFWLNEGGRFRPTEAGLRLDGLCGDEPCLTSSLGWLDVENDGDLDLYVVNNVDHRSAAALAPTEVFPFLAFARAQPALLFRNDAGAFVEVGLDAGVDNPGGKGLGLLVTDHDRDGFADLYVANDLTENRLYLNARDGTFRDASRALGVNEVKSSMGVDAGDYDGDGDDDLVITNVLRTGASLLRNDGPSFVPRADHDGLGRSAAGTGWGVVFFDYDLDGDLDLAHAVGTFFDPSVPDVANQLFRNVGGAFVEVTPTAGAVADAWVSRALVAFDYDLDGDEDLLVANTLGGPPQLLRNDVAAPGGSLRLRLEGASANRDAIGAEVVLSLPDGDRAARIVRSSCSYQASCALVVTFGLGAHPGGDVTVRWPGGDVEDFGSLGAGAWRLPQGGAPARVG